MISKRLLAGLVAALVLLPLAASAAPVPALANPANVGSAPAWLLAPARCAENVTPALKAGTPGSPALPANPFDRRQEKAGFCPDPQICVDYCNDICAPCGGYPVSQCIQNIIQPGCHAICSCYSC